MKPMLRFLAPAALLALVVIPSQKAIAQTSVSYLEQFGPTATVQYLGFNVSVGGTFTLQTYGLNNVDPMILFFNGASSNGAGLGSFLGANDDGGPAQPGWNICGAGFVNSCHSLITSFLAPGGYTLAMSVWDFSEAEARAGSNPWTDGAPNCRADNNWDDCNYSVSLTSDDGTAEVVPEPATMSLLATGLVGLAGLRRRKRA